MEEKRGNFILGIILAILMIVAIVIVIVNPNKVEKTAKTTKNVHGEASTQGQFESNINQINDEEEKNASMNDGGKFCKVNNKIVFYEDANKSIYLYNLDENKTNKIATVESSIDKLYFDGENIYYIPSYYMGKGIYKTDLQGNVKKIYEGSSLQLWISEEKIYFVKQIGYDQINGNPQGTLSVMDKDGNNIKELAENVKNYFYIQNNKIYYTTQDRKMYVIDIDGSNKEELVQGRKFVINTADKYIVYIDYSSQEAKHIFNLDTKEDSIVGYFGEIKEFQGETYINVRIRLDDGSLETDYTLFKIQEDGTVENLGKIANFGTDLKYIINGKAYLSNQQEGTYTIKLENGEKEGSDNYNKCRYFLGGYGYKIDDSNKDDIKIERIEL